jgi:hypothetical protein
LWLGLGCAARAPTEFALIEPKWGKEYWSVILAAQAGPGAEGARDAALARAREMGMPDAALGAGLDCVNGLSTQSLGAPEGAEVAWARFGSRSRAQAFADQFGAKQVVSSRDDCGG